MALICMAVHDTEENGRSEFTEETLKGVHFEAHFYKHRVVVIDNGSCKKTKDYLELLKKQSVESSFTFDFTIITNPENIGTAKAINQGLKLRQPGEFVIKMDNDVVIHNEGWVEEMQEVITRMPKIGILGLKRNDVCESVYSVNTDQRSKLLEVPHENGQRWYVVEECKHVMGTCTMLNPALLDRIGYFYQMDGLYGFDDSVMCVRSSIAGYINCFMHGIAIDHIDPGGTDYTKWKEDYAREMIGKYADLEHAYKIGLQDVYYGGE